jgi:hypothetical protein
MTKNIDKETLKSFENEAKLSIEKTKEIEKNDKVGFDEFLENYYSQL